MCPRAFPILEPHAPKRVDVGREVQSTFPACTPPWLTSICLVVFRELDTDAEIVQVSQRGEGIDELALKISVKEVNLTAREMRGN
jgi:hypothetical protein